ncbi:MAG: adenylate/guanylate cyclase domain-containing protein [Desulfobacteraceae bacterium]|nr:adenylate/guanylate cyclase domain-containing protein [Desulfobacteraceae bacterium]
MRQKIYFVTILGNLIGALLTFVYSTYINVDLNVPQGAASSLSAVVPFVIGTAFIFFVIITINHRWSRPLYQTMQDEISTEGSNGAYPENLKRKALQLVPMLAGTTLLAWIMAGFIFGMLMPVILHTFFGVAPMTLTESLRTIFGIIVIGGFSTSLFIYFATESIWRKQIPLFFPEGDLSEVKGAFKLSVKARLLVVFLMISLIPLTLLGVSAYCKALALQTAGPALGGQIISGLLIQILFITAIGVVLSVTLSLVVSKSVSAPLEEMETAMKEVAKGNLDVRIRVVTNDEIGAVGEGFGRMIKGLKESEAIKESFGKYISQEIRDEILSGSIPLDGEMTRATMLFSDLRDFTPFVESTHPKQVVSIMNQYFSEMAEAIKRNNGLILQYVGDEIEAVFGAPVPYDDHPDMAASAALDMKRRLVHLNERLKAQGVAPFRHGIGIHTGAVLAGIIGSKERSSYALVGDTVNLASRIQGLTKEFACDIILSQTTHDLMAGAYQMEQLRAVKVKGKSEETMVYKLLGHNGSG